MQKHLDVALDNMDEHFLNSRDGQTGQCAGFCVQSQHSPGLLYPPNSRLVEACQH